MWSRGTSPCHFLRHLHIFSSGLTTFTLPEWTQNWLCRLASHEENRFCYFLKYFFHGHPALGRGSCFLELFGGLVSCFCMQPLGWNPHICWEASALPLCYVPNALGVFAYLLACLFFEAGSLLAAADIFEFTSFRPQPQILKACTARLSWTARVFMPKFS